MKAENSEESRLWQTLYRSLQCSKLATTDFKNTFNKSSSGAMGQMAPVKS